MRARGAPVSIPSRTMPALVRSSNGVSTVTGRPSTPRLRARAATSRKDVDELGPAVGVAAVVEGVDADRHRVEVAGLGDGEGQGEEHEVAGRHVGEGDAGRAAGRRDLDRRVDEGGASPPRGVDRATRCSIPRVAATAAGPVELDAVALAVVEGAGRAPPLLSPAATARQTVESRPPERMTSCCTVRRGPLPPNQASPRPRPGPGPPNRRPTAHARSWRPGPRPWGCR